MRNIQVEPGALVPFLTRRYGLPPSTQCSFIRRGGNDHYLVESNGWKHILRLYLNGKYYITSTDDLRFELDLIDFLAAEGLPVARPIPDISGQTLARFESKGETRHAALFEFAEGEGIWKTMEDEQALELGRTVARMHLGMDRFNSEYSRYHLDREFLLDEPLRMLDIYLADRGKGSLGFFRPFAEKLRESVTRAPDTRGAYGLIHCDLGWHNINYHPELGMRMFDFDLCGYSWRAFDLALVRLQFNDGHWATFLDAYDSVRPMSKAERDSIADFVHLWPMWHIGDLFRNRNPIFQLGTGSVDQELEGWLEGLHEIADD